MIIKLSSSGKQLQVVDDEGVVFGTSVEFLKGLLDGRSPKGFLLLTRLPFRVSKRRFAKSPVWVPEGGVKEVVDEDVGTGEDVLSAREQKKRQVKRSVSDEGVKW